uniref:Uncharacterized protein n=1 Tax=Knipowitschia caucasica TaxID=637954 RepID=A0AAV2JHE2_KNICA
MTVLQFCRSTFTRFKRSCVSPKDKLGAGAGLGVWGRAPKGLGEGRIDPHRARASRRMERGIVLTGGKRQSAGRRRRRRHPHIRQGGFQQPGQELIKAPPNSRVRACQVRLCLRHTGEPRKSLPCLFIY